MVKAYKPSDIEILADGDKLNDSQEVQDRARASRRAFTLGGVVLFLLMVIVIGVGASPVYAATLNWTPIVDLLTGMVAIFSPLMDIMMGIAPLVILGSVLSFVTGLLDDLLIGVGGAFRIRRA